MLCNFLAQDDPLQKQSRIGDQVVLDARRGTVGNIVSWANFRCENGHILLIKDSMIMKFIDRVLVILVEEMIHLVNFMCLYDLKLIVVFAV